MPSAAIAVDGTFPIITNANADPQKLLLAMFIIPALYHFSPLVAYTPEIGVTAGGLQVQEELMRGP